MCWVDLPVSTTMVYSTVLGQLGAIGGCLMGTEAGGTGVVRDITG